MPLQPTKPEYAPATGRSQLFSYHAPAGAYAYLIAYAEEHGVSRNKALTMIIDEHAEAAQKRASRNGRKR